MDTPNWIDVVALPRRPQVADKQSREETLLYPE
jgi:hypothetical protein